MLDKKFGAVPAGRQGTAPGIREKLERSRSTASKTERQARHACESAGDRTDQRSARRQRLVAHLHEAGPRPVLEALISVAAGNGLDEVLADFARLPVSIYHALGADVLPSASSGGRGDDPPRNCQSAWR
jgi:hypothetical protein